MLSYAYQTSAYGYPWETREEASTVAALGHVQSDFWLKMLPERHHRIIDSETEEVLWFHKSQIAPKPGTKGT